MAEQPGLFDSTEEEPPALVPHVCTCEDCHREPYADRCKWEARCAELEAELAQSREPESLSDPDAKQLGGFVRGSKTSRQAALDAYPRTGTQRARILQAIAAAGERGMTWGEVEQATNVRSPWKRISELIEGGWVEQKGDETRLIPWTGSEGRVYVLTAKAEERR